MILGHIVPTGFPSYFNTLACMTVKQVLNCILCVIKKVWKSHKLNLMNFAETLESTNWLYLVYEGGSFH